MTGRRCVLLVAMAALAAAPAAAADRATDRATEELIQQLTAGLKTDGQKAVKLYEAGQALTDDAGTQGALLEKAVELGAKDVSSRPVRVAVLAAIEVLSKNDAKRREELAPRKLEVLRSGLKAATGADRQEVGGQLLGMLTGAARSQEREKHWAKAVEYWREAVGVARRVRPDDVQGLQDSADWAKHYEVASQLVADLIEKVKAAPGDTKSRTALLHAFVADMDDPKAAGQWLKGDVEEAWRVRIPQATGALELVAPAAARQLGQWYAGPILRECRSSFSRILVLQRARKYFNHVLDDKTVTMPAERKAVLAELTAAENQLQALGVNVARPATVLICADNEYSLSINGRQVAGGRDWQKLDRHEVKLAPGDVITVRARDDEWGRSAGLFCCVVMRDRTLASGKDWRYTLKPPANWGTAGYGRDKAVSVTNVAANHKSRKFEGAQGAFMWSAETAGTVYFKLVVPR